MFKFPSSQNQCVLIYMSSIRQNQAPKSQKKSFFWYFWVSNFLKAIKKIWLRILDTNFCIQYAIEGSKEVFLGSDLKNFIHWFGWNHILSRKYQLWTDGFTCCWCICYLLLTTEARYGIYGLSWWTILSFVAKITAICWYKWLLFCS